MCDLGCGPGLYTRRFHDAGARVVGVDWSGSSLAVARQEAARTGSDIGYMQLDYTCDPLPAELDLVTLISRDP